MLNPFPEYYLAQVQAQRDRLLAEAARERLYRSSVTTTSTFPGATLVLLAGELFITIGQQLKAWAKPAHQPKPFATARVRSA